jgi:hypothetical protein
MKVVHSILLLTLVLLTASPSRAATEPIPIARLEQQLREAHYARVGIEGHTHVLIKPQAGPDGLRFEHVEKFPRRRYEIVAGAELDSTAPLPNPVPWSRIDHIESGVRTRGRSAMLGGAIGLLTGALLGAALGSIEIEGESSPGDVQMGAFVVGGIFCVAGAGIGALLPSTKWKQVYPEPPCVPSESF